MVNEMKDQLKKKPSLNRRTRKLFVCIPLEATATTVSPLRIAEPSMIFDLSTIPTILDVSIYEPFSNTPGCIEVSLMVSLSTVPQMNLLL
jgi:hypothetical protein